MANIIYGTCGRNIYAEVLTRLRCAGRVRPSRNGPTRDLGYTTIILEEPFNALPIGVGRGVSERIAAAEAIQLIGAFSDPEWLVKLAPQLDAYREPDGNFWGAYGTRIGWQLRDIVEKLRTDPWTRQAVVILWDVAMDNEPGKLDYPCTVSLGFIIQPTPSGDPRGRQLNMNVLMRSNDAWLGLPYDMFQFTQLQHTVARLLGVNRGTYTHTAWSMHIYEKDLEASYAVDVAVSKSDWFDPTGIGELNLTYVDVIRRARIIALAPDEISWDLTASERWYRDTLHGS